MVSREHDGCGGGLSIPFPFCCLASAASFLEKDMLGRSLFGLVDPFTLFIEAGCCFGGTISWSGISLTCLIMRLRIHYCDLKRYSLPPLMGDVLLCGSIVS